jgi:photosystem II stability/assembly factor-like uncharacterized protein
VAVATPPGKTETEHDRDLAQRVADLEALIEEARRRARRRRRLYGVAVLVAVAALGAALLGGGGSRSSSLGGTVGGDAQAAPAVQRMPERWAPSLGPDGGGLTLAIDSTNSAILYAGGWGNVFKSTDAGGSWKDVTTEPWNRVSALAIDPSNHRVVYAGTDRGVAKTIDGGRTWRMVNSGLYDAVTRGRYGEGVASLVIDAHDPTTVYATKQGALFKTTDGGSHWRILGPPSIRTGRFPRGVVDIYGYQVAAAIDPDNAQTIYASWNYAYSNRGPALYFYKSVDGGDHWQRIEPHGLRLISLWSLTVDAAGTLFAVPETNGGSPPSVVKSTDGGVTWSAAGALSATPWGLELDSGSLYASTSAGLFRTDDEGVTWQPEGRGANLPGGSVVTDPRNPSTVYGMGDGVVKSLDGGRTWAAADRGLVSTLIPSIALAPGRSRTIYAGGYGSVFKSSDGGRAWQVEQGLGSEPVDTLVVDPRDGHTLYAAESWYGGLYKSADAGAHWSRIQTPFPSKGVRSIAIDPQNPRTIYVSDCGGACNGGTVQRTDDGGVTWRPTTPIAWAVRSLAVDPRHPSTIYAGTNRGDIMRSSDGGRSWLRVVVPPDHPLSRHYAIVAIAIDPRNPDNVYAARAAEGIVKSSDGGRTWHRANAGLTDGHLAALAIDPHDPRILYVSTGPGSGALPHVFRSTDSAATWQPLDAGLPAVGVTAFAVDASGKVVLAATEGDGVIKLRHIPVPPRTP